MLLYSPTTLLIIFLLMMLCFITLYVITYVLIIKDIRTSPSAKVFWILLTLIVPIIGNLIFIIRYYRQQYLLLQMQRRKVEKFSNKF